MASFLNLRRATFVFVLILIAAAAFAASTPPIEIWKSQGVGCFGDFCFYVSTGSSRTPTPAGRFTVQKKVIDYWSKKFDRAMPYAIFFTSAHAIHAGDLTTRSKGCIRVDYPTAEYLYYYARTGQTRIIIHP